MKNIFSIFRDKDDIEEQDEVFTPSQPAPQPPIHSTFTVSSAKEQAIHVVSASNFAEIKKVADGLMDGVPQLVTFEKTTQEVAERLTDFLNGVIYGLDGYVSKVSDRIYLFTPRGIEIKADVAPATPPASTTGGKPFFDKLGNQ